MFLRIKSFVVWGGIRIGDLVITEFQQGNPPCVNEFTTIKTYAKKVKL